MNSTFNKALSALILCLALGLVLWWVDGQGALRETRWQPPAPMQPDFTGLASTLPAPAAPDLSQFLATLERPLFSATRKPPTAVQAAAPSEAPPDALNNLHIYGVFEGAQSGMLAKVDGKVSRIVVGETFSGWTLKSISGRDATVVRNGEERTLSLTTARGAVAKQSTPMGAALPPNVPPGAMAPASAAPATATTVQKNVQGMEDERRERLRRRNELRAKAGARPISE